jgi:hypothetical protein
MNEANSQLNKSRFSGQVNIRPSLDQTEGIECGQLLVKLSSLDKAAMLLTNQLSIVEKKFEPVLLPSLKASGESESSPKASESMVAERLNAVIGQLNHLIGRLDTLIDRADI